MICVAFIKTNNWPCIIFDRERLNAFLIINFRSVCQPFEIALIIQMFVLFSCLETFSSAPSEYVWHLMNGHFLFMHLIHFKVRSEGFALFSHFFLQNQLKHSERIMNRMPLPHYLPKYFAFLLSRLTKLIVVKVCLLFIKRWQLFSFVFSLIYLNVKNMIRNASAKDKKQSKMNAGFHL